MAGTTSTSMPAERSEELVNVASAAWSTAFSETNNRT
jgi:hypothetical protein